MLKKHQCTLERLFTKPTPSNIKWDDVLSLMCNLGADISEGRGSRVRIALNGVKAVFHKPHPSSDIDKGAITSIRRFLENAGIHNDEI